MSHTHIVKRKKHQEPYDSHKVYASCYAAGLDASLPKEKAEALCAKVVKEIKQWIDGKNEVSSNEIFKKITKAMRTLNKDAAFMYETHRDIS